MFPEVEMTNEQATRRYFGVLVPAAVVFLGTSYGIKLIDGADLLPPAGLYAIALVPVAMLLSLFWAHWRYMNDIDEFLRSIQIKATLAGLAVVLAIASGWGFLEFYADVPALSIFWLNPIFWVAHAIAAVVLNLRYGRMS